MASRHLKKETSTKLEIPRTVTPQPEVRLLNEIHPDPLAAVVN